MARELRIVITADGSQAKRELADVDKSIDKIDDGAKQIDKTFAITSSGIAKSLAAIGFLEIANQIFEVAEQVAAYASEIQNAAAMTGVGSEKLQELNYAVVASGVSLNELTGALAQLSKRLVEGDQSVVQAVAQLGLSVKDLIAMDPAEAFLVIAERIAGVENPMKQAALAMDLFGKSGAKLLPAMKDDLRGLMEQAEATGSVMDRELVAKAAAFDDTLTRLGITAKAWAARAFEASEATAEWAATLTTFGASAVSAAAAAAEIDAGMVQVVDRLSRAHVGAQVFVRDGLQPLTLSTNQLREAEKQLDDNLRKMTGTRDRHTRELEKAAHAAEKLDHAYQALMSSIRNEEGLALMARDAQIMADATDAIAAGLMHIDGLLPNLAKVGPITLPGLITQNQPSLTEFSPTFGQQIAQNLTMTISKALMGGGDVVKSAASVLGGMFGEHFSTQIGGKLSGLLGKQLGGAIGGIMGPLGSMLGPLISDLVGKLGKKIWSGIQGWFGTDEEAKLVNPARDAFLKLFGGAGTGIESGFGRLAAKLTEITGEEGGGQLFKALISADTMQEFEAAKRQIEDVLSSTTTGATDATTATDGLTVALTGSDAAIDALGKTQERVVATMLEGFDRLIAKVSEFLALMGGVSSASVNIPVPSSPGADWEPPNYVPGSGWPSEYPGFASGTQGRYLDFGAGTPVVLHGKERVMTEAEGRAESGGLTVNVSVSGGTIIGSADEFKRAVTTAVLDGVMEGGKPFARFQRLQASALAGA